MADSITSLLRDVAATEQFDFNDARKFFTRVDFAAAQQVRVAVGEAVVFFGQVVLDGGKEGLPEGFAYLLVGIEDDRVFCSVCFEAGEGKQG